MITITELQKAIDLSVNSLGGIGGAIDACDRMYNATFRTKAFKLSEIEDWEYSVDSLKTDIACVLYANATGQALPVNDYDASDEYGNEGFCYEMEAYSNSAEEWAAVNHPNIEVNCDTLVVEFCNYKGEGEGGIELHILNKHLPIYKSKLDSFNQVN